jgi:hypothetical protein
MTLAFGGVGTHIAREKLVGDKRLGGRRTMRISIVTNRGN